MPWTNTLSAGTEEQRSQSIPIPSNGYALADEFGDCIDEDEIDDALTKLRPSDTPGTQPAPQLLSAFDS